MTCLANLKFSNFVVFLSCKFPCAAKKSHESTKQISAHVWNQYNEGAKKANLENVSSQILLFSCMNCLFLQFLSNFGPKSNTLARITTNSFHPSLLRVQK